MFVKNPNLPTVLNDKLLALEGKTQSEVVARNRQANHEVRKAFVECESSEKIRRAQRYNARNTSTLEFQPREKVYYKRKDSDYWRGPSEVIGKDSNQIILKHGGLFVRTHPVSLKRSLRQIYLWEPRERIQREHQSRVGRHLKLRTVAVHNKLI